MIGTLARKRTNWAALAVLAALAVALFAVLQTASAAPSLKISIGDSDNVIKAPSSHTITLTVEDDDDAVYGSAYVTYVTASSGVIVTGGGSPVALSSLAANLVVPSAAEGVYTISARVTSNEAGDNPLEAELDVTVGDPGTPIGAVETSVGKVNHVATNAASTAIRKAAVDATVAGTDNDHLANLIPVEVSVLNSLGNAPNPTEVSQVIVFAAGGDVYPVSAVDSGTGAVTLGTVSPNSATFEEDGSDPDDVGAKTQFYIGANNAGTVDVTAVVIGTGGSQTSAALSLTFTGDAAIITLGPPSSPLSQNGTARVIGVDADNNGSFDDAGDTAPVESSGEATIAVTATDKSGNTATLVDGDDANDDGDFEDAGDTAPSVTVAIIDADDESVGDKITATVTQTLNAKGDEVPTSLTITLNGTEAAPGEYTVTVTLSATEKKTATIIVAGPAANIALEVSESTVNVGSIVTVTATVTDAGGNLVPDAGTVTFNAVGALTLVGLDDADDDMGGEQATLDDGVASVRYVVTAGSGTATIIVTTGKADAVTSVSTEAAEAVEEVEEIGLNCLSETAGFATWTCETSASASEIYGDLAGRGATALLLWNGSAWVRYAVRDGAELPGSSDFMIHTNDILYISN